MERKRLYFILGAVSAAILLVLATIFPVIANLLTSDPAGSQAVSDIELCDKNDDDLCVLAFGAGSGNDMSIILQLPGADYPAFYVKATSRGVESAYSCETGTSLPSIAFCTGVRAPLGEPIEIAIYSTEDDLLIANGTIAVSSMVMSFSNSMGNGFGPMGKVPTPTPSATPIATFTPTPLPAYPNP
jgi:hypothetical protein